MDTFIYIYTLSFNLSKLGLLFGFTNISPLNTCYRRWKAENKGNLIQATFMAQQWTPATFKQFHKEEHDACGIVSCIEKRKSLLTKTSLPVSTPWLKWTIGAASSMVRRWRRHPYRYSPGSLEKEAWSGKCRFKHRRSRFLHSRPFIFKQKSRS